MQDQRQYRKMLQFVRQRTRTHLFLACFMAVITFTANMDIRRTLQVLDMSGPDLDIPYIVLSDAEEEHTDNGATFNGSSPNNPLSYTIRRGNKYNMTFAREVYRCHVGKSAENSGHSKGRAPLLESLQPHLDFTTFIQTSHRILVLGDSVAIQFGQLLEEAMGAIPSSRHILHESWHGHEGLTISATQGGGAVAHLRMTGMFLPSGEGKPIANYGKGWNRTHVERLIQHPHLSRNESNPEEAPFDVMIFRIPHGWLQFQHITEETIKQSIQLAHDIFGVKKVILVDLPFNNNIKTIKGLEDRQQTNEMIHGLPPTLDVAASSTNRTNRVQVTTLQFAQFTDHLMHHNAHAIGWNTSELDELPSYALDRLGCKHFALSIAQGCATTANSSDCECPRNRVSQDGMHWCLESIGGRFTAGIACLIGCFQEPGGGVIVDAEELLSCEEQCNSQFMSLRPLDF